MFFILVWRFGSIIGLLVTNRPVMAEITPNSIVVLLYMGIFIKEIGYVFYLGAMNETTAIIASTVFLIKSALAPLIALILLQESIKNNVIAGIVFIIVGSYINFRYKKNNEANKLSLSNEEKNAIMRWQNRR